MTANKGVDKKKDIDKKELEAILKIKDYKLIAESNIVSILWKNPDLYHNYDNLNLKMFTHNEWKVYWQIGYDLIIVERKAELDEITIGLYLEKHPKLKAQYDEYGGFDTINKATKYVTIKNIDGYINELNKWNTVLNLVKNKFPIADRLSDFVDMTSEEIYDEYEAMLNHIFINVEDDDKTYDISDGVEELIDELDEGLAVGLPLYNSPMLNKEIGGNLVGNITLCGGLSGVGKSSFGRNVVIPSMIHEGEKMVVMINEEGKKKWQRELLIWVANNVYKKDMQKYTLRDGKFTEEMKTFLKEKCAKWIKDHKEIIILKPFQKYSTDKAIKTIKKYSHMGVKYFMLDTYKADADANNSEAFWFNLQQNMVKISDVIKPEAKNVHIWITFQLAKSSAKQRFYGQDNVGLAKNIIDVASTCLMIRWVLEDEYEEGKHKLHVYKLGGKSGKSKIPVALDKNKHYQIIFIVKNREGSANTYQIVVEHDLSKNIYKEVGMCVVPVDF